MVIAFSANAAGGSSSCCNDSQNNILRAISCPHAFSPAPDAHHERSMPVTVVLCVHEHLIRDVLDVLQSKPVVADGHAWVICVLHRSFLLSVSGLVAVPLPRLAGLS